jgi:Na+:H+ antiporter, NhaA family
MESERPPEASPLAHRALTRVLGPIERYLHVEATSGIVLLLATAVALVWATQSPSSYDAVWHTPITFGIGTWVASKSLHFCIDEGLMTVFFFVVGLEIRREIHEGELAEPRRAALPIVAALGGMLAPAAIYAAFNAGTATQSGWGVPMATDIAFAVGVLALLGKRVPPALRVLLLALAIIDDIGAILVIAFFYSAGIDLSGLVIVLSGIVLIVLLQRLGVRRTLIYAVPTAVVWWGFLRAGVHATIAGVIIGLLTPARPWFGKRGFVSASREALDTFESRTDGAVEDLIPQLRRMKEAQREALSPVVRAQALFHPWVAFAVIPIFALANAGVAIAGVNGEAWRPMIGIAIGLVVGKPLGIVAATFVSTRLRLTALPHGVRWSGVLLVGLVAGIGFTMAIFIATLAFHDEGVLRAGKLSVLAASMLSAMLGVGLGRLLLPAERDPRAATCADEAEASTEL